jgi:hypothetical protein
MALPVPFDAQIAVTLRVQIDPCEFRAVKRHVRNPASAIQMVVLVQEPYALEEVAAVFATAGNSDAALQTLLGQGVIRFGVDDRSRVQVSSQDCVVLLESIPDQQDCHVIYLPPCYVVQTFSRPGVRRTATGGE